MNPYTQAQAPQQQTTQQAPPPAPYQPQQPQSGTGYQQQMAQALMAQPALSSGAMGNGLSGVMQLMQMYKQMNPGGGQIQQDSNMPVGGFQQTGSLG